MPNLKTLILACVDQIPLGKVSTYGTIAIFCRSQPRFVAFCLASLPEDTHIPWHRVVNAQGRISVHPNLEGSVGQYQKLLAEGIVFSPKGQILDFKGKLFSQFSDQNPVDSE